MEVTRTQDAELVSRLVSEAVGQPVDMSTFVADERNYALLGENGVMLFGLTKPGSYAVTSAVGPMGFGQWAVEFGRATTRWMFENTDAMRLWATCTHETRHAIVTMKAAIDCDVEHTGPLHVASITRDKWSANNDSMAG